MKKTDQSDVASPRGGGDVSGEGITEIVRGGGDISGKGVAIDAIATTAAIVSAAGGLKFVLEMARLWIEARKDRRIKIKKGDVEMELQGSMSDRDIASKIEHFERLARKQVDNEIKILIP